MLELLDNIQMLIADLVVGYGTANLCYFGFLALLVAEVAGLTKNWLRAGKALIYILLTLS